MESDRQRSRNLEGGSVVFKERTRLFHAESWFGKDFQVKRAIPIIFNVAMEFRTDPKYQHLHLQPVCWRLCANRQLKDGRAHIYAYICQRVEARIR